MTDTVEPITRGERALGNVLLHQPCGGFSQLDIGPYKIGIAITTEDGEQDPEKAGEALEEFVRRAVASEAREKRLQAELDALNDNGALHTAYLSGQRDAKERIAALRASEERIKKLEEALDWFCVQSEVWLDGRVETAKPGWMKVAIARARQALGE